MGAAQYLYKRGSTYWWRRRLPLGVATSGSVIDLSLKTKSLPVAKRIGAEVARTAEQVFWILRDNMISVENARKIIAKTALKVSAYINVGCAVGAAYGLSNIESHQNRVRGWTYRLLSARGKSASVGPAEVAEMRAAGLDDETIRLVDHVRAHIQVGAFPPPRDVIEELLDEFGLNRDPISIAQAQQLYLRGLSAAFLDDRRQSLGIRPDDEAVLQSALLARASSSGLPPKGETPEREETRWQSPPVYSASLTF